MNVSTQKVAITGAHGLIGGTLSGYLTAQGYEVIALHRGDGNGQSWNPETGEIDASIVDGCVAFIHLSGEPIIGRWTAKKKAAIHTSRVETTKNLAKAVALLPHPPQAFLCASATGFYGDRGNEILTEDSASGADFLACVCRDWEAATQPASSAGIRVVNLRFGVVLSSRGGAFAAMLLPFKLGVGGVIGSGRQWFSWITLEDALRAIEHALANPTVRGPVNIVAPQPVTNRELTRALGRALHRPTGFALPAFIARLALGEMADSLLLSGARVKPMKLEESGFIFHHPQLKEALRHLLKG